MTDLPTLCRHCGGDLQRMRHFAVWQVAHLPVRIPMEHVLTCVRCRQPELSLGEVKRHACHAAQVALASDRNELVGPVLRYAREAQGFSVHAMATLLMVDPARLTAWENGATPIPEDIIALMVSALTISSADYSGFQDTRDLTS